MNVKDDSGKGSIHGGSTPTVALAPEKQALFERRFEEGYDLYDAEYDQWLLVCHTEANHHHSDIHSRDSTQSLLDSFTNVEPLEPVGTLILFHMDKMMPSQLPVNTTSPSLTTSSGKLSTATPAAVSCTSTHLQRTIS